MPKLKPNVQRARREHILDAAEQCFGRAGFHRTTMHDICKEAAVSPGALYVYFDSKEALIAGICERDRQEFAERFDALAAAPDFLEALRALGEQYFLEAIRAGASGYVLKSVADHDLITACRAAMRGEPFVYPAVERSLLGRALADDESSAVLTGRESQILALIADGHTSREIADMLVISPRTVERHRENLRHKLGLRNRVDLTRYAIRAGLIAP